MFLHVQEGLHVAVNNTTVLLPAVSENRILYYCTSTLFYR